MKKKTWLVMGMVAALLLGGCGAGTKNDSITMAESYGDRCNAAAGWEETDEVFYSSKQESSALKDSYENGGLGFHDRGSAETELYHAENEKLIRTVTMNLQTKEFENLLAYVDGRVAELDGYVQYSQIYGNSIDSFGYRSASLTLRIPQNSLDTFVSGVSENATVVRKSENAENVTLQYADTEARLKALQIEQERFLELLEKADTVESILVLEEHLTELRYEIESYASALKLYDNKVNYATVTLDISEVKRTKPVEQDPTLLTRMKDGFSDTWYRIKEGAASFLVWVVTNFLYLLIWGLVLAAAVIFIRKACRKRKEKAEKGTTLQRSDEERNDRMDFEK